MPSAIKRGLWRLRRTINELDSGTEKRHDRRLSRLDARRIRFLSDGVRIERYRAGIQYGHSVRRGRDHGPMRRNARASSTRTSGACSTTTRATARRSSRSTISPPTSTCSRACNSASRRSKRRWSWWPDARAHAEKTTDPARQTVPESRNSRHTDTRPAPLKITGLPAARPAEQPIT